MVQNGSTLRTFPASTDCRYGRCWLLATLMAWLALGGPAITGCSRLSKPNERSYTTVPKKPRDKAEAAKTLNATGLEHMHAGDSELALDAFKEALAADVNYGPAHNNLGQLYLDRKQLYLAAWEFEFASKLMPQRPEPYINLGLVFEMAGQDANAQAQYETALQLAPDNVDALTSLARLLVKQDVDPMRVQYLLSQIVMLDKRPQWRRWAQDQLGTRYGLDAPAQTTPGLFEHGPEFVPPGPIVQPIQTDVPTFDVPVGALPTPPIPTQTATPLAPITTPPPLVTPSPSDGKVIATPSLDLGGDLQGLPAGDVSDLYGRVQSSSWEKPVVLPQIDPRGLPTVPASYAKDLP